MISALFRDFTHTKFETGPLVARCRSRETTGKILLLDCQDIYAEQCAVAITLCRSVLAADAKHNIISGGSSETGGIADLLVTLYPGETCTFRPPTEQSVAFVAVAQGNLELVENVGAGELAAFAPGRIPD